MYTLQCNFLPVKEYAKNVCPGMDWERVAGAGVDTHRMPVFPAGMMVEPFVKQTAAELRECIDRALELEPAGHDNPSTSDSG